MIESQRSESSAPGSPKTSARVLILGASGLLGHKLYQVLATKCEVYGTVRRFDERLRDTNMFDPLRIIEGVDAWDISSVKRAIRETKPGCVVNCIGIVKQLREAQLATPSIYINALFPHLLVDVCKETEARLVHISTDCVFSGARGKYREDDLTDAVDLYGRTKALGEVVQGRALTLRTSIIGRGLFSNVSLVDWFLSQAGRTVQGFKNAIYTGLPTIVLSEEIWRVVNTYPTLNGLYQVSSARISKLELLTLVNKFFQVGADIEPTEEPYCDRSLLGDRYRMATGFSAPSWPLMVEAMANDPTPYNRFRKVLREAKN